MTEVIQAQRHGQKSDSHSNADPPLASEDQVPKWQCRKHMPSSKQALKIHRHTRCLCLTLKLFAYAPAWPTFLFFLNTFRSAVVWAADFHLSLSKIYKVEQHWSVLRTPCLPGQCAQRSDTWTAHALAWSSCSIFVLSTLEAVPHHLIIRASPTLGEMCIWTFPGAEVNDRSSSIPWVNCPSTVIRSRRGPSLL